MPELFHRLSRNVFAIFSGRNLLWHALAILLTIVIVTSGFDWTYFRWTRGDEFATNNSVLVSWPSPSTGFVLQSIFRNPDGLSGLFSR
jgi:hypothetical protein